MVGNFIADHVKGKEAEGYPDKIRQGILLHRAIDQYTDQHPAVRQSKKRLYPRFGHYAAVLVDLYYDHFLAANFNELTGLNLLPFTQETYRTLNQHWEYLPKRTRFMLPFMEKDNWLFAYRTLGGLSQACQGISRRARFKNNMADGAAALEADYSSFSQDFHQFFPRLEAFVESWNAE